MEQRSTSDRIIILLYGLAIAVVYILLHGLYRPFNTDDAWFLSFAYNHIVRGIHIDTVFGRLVGAGGVGGVVVFGKTFTYIYGSILNLIGWTKGNAHLISSLFIFASSFIWFKVLKKLGFNEKTSLFFALALLLVEPFFGAANQGRSDALLFFISSSALLSFIHQRYLLAGFLSMVAFETHPVGAVACFFYLLAVTISTRVDPKKIALPLLGGLLIGTLYYIGLHYQNLGQLIPALVSGNSSGQNMLYIYFFKTKFMRHLPELVLLLACAAVLFWKKYYREKPFILLFLACSLAIALIIKRPNFHYVVFIYPSFLLLIMYIFEKLNWLKALMVMILLYLIAQYTFVFLNNRDFDLNSYLKELNKAVPEDNLVIVGSPNDWFAFKDRDFYVASSLDRIKEPSLTKFYLIDEEPPLQNEFRGAKDFIIANYHGTIIKGFDHNGHKTVIRKISK